MPSKLSIIAIPVALALLTSAAFADQQLIVPPEADEQLIVAPEVDSHTTCLRGFGTGAQALPTETLECTSIRVAPDPEDCPGGERLISVWRGFGNLTHVCAPSGNRIIP